MFISVCTLDLALCCLLILTLWPPPFFPFVPGMLDPFFCELDSFTPYHRLQGEPLSTLLPIDVSSALWQCG